MQDPLARNATRIDDCKALKAKRKNNYRAQERDKLIVYNHEMNDKLAGMGLTPILCRSHVNVAER